MAANTYTVVVAGSGGWLRQELPVTVEVGVKRRVDGVMGLTLAWRFGKTIE